MTPAEVIARVLNPRAWTYALETANEILSALASAGYAVVPMEPQPKAKISDSHAMLCTCDACIVGR